jgi:starch phosphorylase
VSGQNLLDRFNCGEVAFAGGDNALYERHLTFDQVVPVGAATDRDKFEAIARSIRDVLSQRWLKTEQTYQERNVKRVYYVSLEFLIGPHRGQHFQSLRARRVQTDPRYADSTRRLLPASRGPQEL